MNCPNCNHVNNGGNFCEACGTRLSNPEIAATGTDAQQSIPGSPNTYAGTSTPGQPQQSLHLENAKKISKMYWNFFLTTFKKPYAASETVGKENFVNGLITIGLYALIIPLMIYVGMGDFREYIDSPFVNMVIKPTLGYAIFILLVGTFSFFSIKLGAVNASYQDVIARFGTLLVPFVGILALAFILALLQIKLFVLILFIGFISSIFVVPPLVISSFKSRISAGLDTVYGTILSYVLTFITIGIMGEILFSMIIDAVENMMGSFLF